MRTGQTHTGDYPVPRALRVRASLTLTSACLFALAGCSVFHWGSPLPSGGATYHGYLSVDGQDLWTTVRLAPRAGEVAAELIIRDGPSAAGAGELDGRRFYIGLEYAGECAGRIVLTGEFVSGGSEIEGTARASDCTGQMTGRFRLSQPSVSAALDG